LTSVGRHVVAEQNTLHVVFVFVFMDSREDVHGTSTGTSLTIRLEETALGKAGADDSFLSRIVYGMIVCLTGKNLVVR
jgi:hypothetical protein